MNAFNHDLNLSVALDLVGGSSDLHTTVSSSTPMMFAVAPVEQVGRVYDLMDRAPDVFERAVYVCFDAMAEHPWAYVGMTDSGRADKRIDKRMFDPDVPLFSHVGVWGCADTVDRDHMTALEAIIMHRVRAIRWTLQNLRFGECHAGAEVWCPQIRAAVREAETLLWGAAVQVLDRGDGDTGEGDLAALGHAQAAACDQVFVLNRDGLVAYLGTLGGRHYLLAGSEVSSSHRLSLDVSTRRTRRNLRDLGLLRRHPTRADALVTTAAVPIYETTVAARLVTGQPNTPASAWVPCDRPKFVPSF